MMARQCSPVTFDFSKVIENTFKEFFSPLDKLVCSSTYKYRHRRVTVESLASAFFFVYQILSYFKSPIFSQ